MGTFGLGGLHRQSTWLCPYPTLADLPPAARDGSVTIVLDTNTPYQYDTTLGWIPLIVGGGVGSRIYNEILTGLINGINTAFTTGVDFVFGTETVYFNGVRQLPGASVDYVASESGGAGSGYDTITFTVAPRGRPGPRIDDVVSVDYDSA